MKLWQVLPVFSRFDISSDQQSSCIEPSISVTFPQADMGPRGLESTSVSLLVEDSESKLQTISDARGVSDSSICIYNFVQSLT